MLQSASFQRGVGMANLGQSQGGDRARVGTGRGVGGGAAGGEAREGRSPSPEARLDLRALPCKRFR